MPSNLILFDGDCLICNGSVRFIYRNDSEKLFRFTPLQSQLGQRYAQQFGPFGDTMVLIESGKVYVRSRAVIRIGFRLRWYHRFAVSLLACPAFLLDRLYDVLASKRHRLAFGLKAQCELPSADFRARLIP